MRGLTDYLDKDGRVMRWPGKRHRAIQKSIIDYLATRFDPGMEYNEAEVNAVLNAWHLFGDHALLRRELFDAHWLNRTRDGHRYWREDGLTHGA